MELKHSQIINAPLNVVWDTTIDINNWNKWTPTVEAATLKAETFALGSSATLKQPGMPSTIWTVTHFQNREKFSWKTSFLGMEMIASHHLKAVASEITENTLELEIRGIMALLLGPIIRKKLQGALTSENEGLKKFCEKI